MTPEAETELGREVRAAVAAALKRFGKNDIAAIRVTTLRKLDAFLNPTPQGFEIPVHRCDARPYQLMEEAAVERMKERV